MKTKTMKEWACIALMGLMMPMLTACTNDEITPNPDEKQDGTENGTESVEFLFTFICPSNILEQGEFIMTYNVNNGASTVVNTLKKDDFIQGNGEQVAVNIDNSRKTVIDTEHMYYKLALQYDKFNTQQKMYIQYHAPSGYILTPTYYFSARTKDKEGNVIDKKLYDVGTPSFTNITTQESTKLIAGRSYEIDANGIITFKALNEDDLWVCPLTEEQEKYVSECINRLFARAKGEADKIITAAASIDEESEFIYAEVLPSNVFGKDIDIDLRLTAKDEVILYYFRIKLPESEKWNYSTRISNSTELENKLDDPTFREKALKEYTTFINNVLNAG